MLSYDVNLIHSLIIFSSFEEKYFKLITSQMKILNCYNYHLFMNKFYEVIHNVILVIDTIDL
jgi:hypothetical protein